MIDFLSDKNISVEKNFDFFNNILKDAINRKHINKNIIDNYIKDKKIGEVDDIEYEIKYDSLNINNVEDDIINIYNNIKNNESFKVFLYNKKVYVLVTRGKMNTGGYTVLIDKMYAENNDSVNNELNDNINDNISKELYDDIIIKVVYKDPPKGCMCIQCFTFPYVLVETTLDKLPNKVTFKVE